MNTLERIIVVLALVGTPAYGATMKGTVRTADGAPIAATVTVLYSSQGVSVNMHPTDEIRMCPIRPSDSPGYGLSARVVSILAFGRQRSPMLE